MCQKCTLKTPFWVENLMLELFQRTRIFGRMRCGLSKIASLILATITAPVPTLHSNGEDGDIEKHLAIWNHKYFLKFLCSFSVTALHLADISNGDLGKG